MSLFLAIILSVTLHGCQRRGAGGTVVLYSSVDESYSSEIARRFEEKTGIVVKLVSDTEAAKSTGLLNRLVAEKRRPVADVFWSGDLMRAAYAHQEGISEAMPGLMSTEPGMAAHSHAGGHFYSAAARLRMIIYHRGRAGAETLLPTAVLDLAKPEFASNACIANPLFGTTSMHAAALFESLGDERAEAFFEEFSRNGGRMLASNGEVKRRVSNGEFAYGLTDSDDISVALADGKDIGFVIPDQHTSGAVMIPSCALLIRGAPHPDNARKLVEFLCSAEVEVAMAESLAAHFPLRPDLEPPEVFGVKLVDLKTQKLDPARLAQRVEELQDGFLKRWVESQQR